MPADLTKPFSESCCDGGSCNTQESCQPCGCDKGLNYLCAIHKFKVAAMELVTAWRDQANFYGEERTETDEAYEGYSRGVEITYSICADELEKILD